MLLGNQHAEKALVADIAPDIVGDVVQLMADVPVVELAAQLLGRSVEKGALLGGEGDRIDPAEPRPVGRAGKQLGVPADGAGLKRFALGVRDGRHRAFQSAIDGKHDIIALEMRESEREQPRGEEPAEQGAEIECRRVHMAVAEADLQAESEQGDGERPGPKRGAVHRQAEQRSKPQEDEDELSHRDTPNEPLPPPRHRSKAWEPGRRRRGQATFPRLLAFYGPDGSSVQALFWLQPPC